MPVFALYNFDDPTQVLDEATANGAQNGIYANGPLVENGQMNLNGINQSAKIYAASEFQMGRGTVTVDFTVGEGAIIAPQTLISRDSLGENPGSLRVELHPDGRISVTHEAAGGSLSLSTPEGFYSPGDILSLSYSFDEILGGGLFHLSNLDQDTIWQAPVPAGYGLDMGALNQPWLIGAGQAASDPGMLNNIAGFFAGSVTKVSFSDSLDPPPVSPPQSDRDGIVRGSEGDDLIDQNYPDPWDADRVDNGDAIIAGDSPEDDRILAGAGNDSVYAGLGDDIVWGGAGNDVLHGDEGDDSLYGGQGADSVYGGVGDDVIDTSGPIADQRPDIGYPGYYDADTDPNDDRDLVYGGAGADHITTGDDADTIYGGAGDDTIFAGFDADYVDGGEGNDLIVGGEGADTIYGRQGDDLIYGGLDDSFAELVDIPDDRDLRPHNNADLIYGGSGNDTIYGRDDADTIYGGSGDDLIYGGIDDDSILGGVGHDTLHGDDGNDSLSGMAGRDLLFGGAGDDVLEGGFGRDTLYGGAGADTLYGGDGQDLLYGGEGANLLFGGAGNDTLYASVGQETLYGGADRDLFVVATPAAGIGSFIDGNEEGADYDTLDLRGGGRLTVSYDSDNAENGNVTYFDENGAITGSLRFVNIENVIPCFTPGSMIATPKGEIAAEDLRVGDRVITRDNGIQEILWVGQRKLTGAELRLNMHLQPVWIRAHSLGKGLPERDMLVSPNHRILVANDRTQLYFEDHEVLVAAKHLTGSKGISSITASNVTYIHFMCARHEVVLSDGAWTETFQPGDYTLKGMGNAQRNEIFEIFPDLRTPEGLENFQAARRTLKRHEAKLLIS